MWTTKPRRYNSRSVHLDYALIIIMYIVKNFRSVNEFFFHYYYYVSYSYRYTCVCVGREREIDSGFNIYNMYTFARIVWMLLYNNNNNEIKIK